MHKEAEINVNLLLVYDSLGHYKETTNLEGSDACRCMHIKDLEGLVQRAGYERVAIIAEPDHLHQTLVASLH
jgi:hypothetical protein